MRKARTGEGYLRAVRNSLVKSLHPKQREALSLIEGGERYISLCCGRRGGKTRLISSMIGLLLPGLKFGEEIVFVAPTLKRGKELIWADVERIVLGYELGYTLRAHEGSIRTEAGGMFRIVGLDNQKQVGKIARGGNARAFFADEVQEFSHLLQKLIDAATPALGQTRGYFVASGTPGFSRRGFWYELCHGGEGFKNVSWTLYDNPFLGRPAAEIVDEEITRRGWQRDHPTLRREWLAEWLDDIVRKVVDISDINLVTAIPEYDPAKWRHVIGVDYGHSPDPTAWVVLAAHPHKNMTAVVHAEYGMRLTSDEICRKTDALRQAFGVKKIVGDSASGGSTFIADFNARHGRQAGFSMAPAEKADKASSIELVNTELRTGRLLVLRDAASVLLEECASLYWDEHHKGFLPGADHAYDALRYALRAARGYLVTPEVREQTGAERELELVKARNRRAASQQAGFWR